MFVIPWPFDNNSILQYRLINLLTPVPAVTGHDEHWPLFHFWCHHFGPKLASSVLKFCRRRMSLQIWSLRYAQNSQTFEWKTCSNISCNYTWLLHYGKNYPSQWCCIRNLWTESKTVEAQSLLQKDKKRRKRKGEKKLKERKASRHRHKAPGVNALGKTLCKPSSSKLKMTFEILFLYYNLSDVFATNFCVNINVKSRRFGVVVTPFSRQIEYPVNNVISVWFK